jgi:lipopolysaccharide transport system permease protein
MTGWSGETEGIPVVVIQPSPGWALWNPRELWGYRELLYFLVWRDIKVRYKQTLLGAAWAVLQPLATMVVFTIFFGRLANVGSEGLPYPIFSFAALLPWTFFAQGLTGSSNSVVGSANLITKVYFPRLIIPVAAVLTGVVDFAIASVLLIPLMATYDVWPGAAVILAPVFLILCCGVCLGAGLWLAALNAEFRDVRYVIPFLVQMWLFVTPVIYPASRVLAMLRRAGLPAWLLGLNPMAGVVEGFRWTLLGTPPPPLQVVIASAAMAAVLLVSGMAYFRRMERSFADVV